MDRDSIVQIKGSDTEVNLTQAIAEYYMQMDSMASIAVTGGGSGTGIAALINGKTDIANSSRPMKEVEIELARAQGIEPFGTPFAIDGLAIITHPDIKLEGLTIEQLGAIYRGEIKDWSELGAKAGLISFYGRQSSSGTFVFFRDNIVKAEYDANMKQMSGNGQIVEAVRNDPNGIGYVGIGYASNEDGKPKDGLGVINIAKNDTAPAVSPLIAKNIIEGVYPVTRALYQFTDSVPTGKVLDFIRFELSEEGQKMIQEGGYYPLTPDYIEYNRKHGIIP